MKKNAVAFALLILLFLKYESSTASHAVGADLTYVCLGGNNYRFFLTFYRDCSGIAVNPSYTISGTSTCGGSVSVTVDLDSTIEIKHTCSSIVTQCVNAVSPYMGIEANYYHGDVTLPSVCNYWTFGINPAICNRNAAINNLDPNGATWCLYVRATLNNDAVQCNNSPSFLSIPVQFLCAGQVQYYIEQTYDMDGDSLHYQMITPHSDAATDVQYVPGLSATQPVFYVNPTQFNSQTGDVRFYALNAQITVMAIQVDEYRNGILIGSVERDIELIFENCPNNLPVASGINGAIFYSTHVCADSLLSFQIYTNDLDSAQQTWLTWNGGIPGATFTTSGTHRDIGYFHWQPGIGDISTQPYVFSVSVSDSACPYIGVSSYSYAVYVDSCFATGISSLYGNPGYQFSANYVQGSHSIHFSYKLGKAMAAAVSLYDLTGRELKRVFIKKESGADHELDVQGLAKGLYTLNLKADDGISRSAKVVVE